MTISARTNRRKSFHAKGTNILKGLLGVERGRHANFDRILPKQMEKLLTEGLFVRDENVEGGYRITPLGMKRLKEFGE